MNTKQLILETTLKLMIENQDSIISIRQISNASGITIGGIYHYFSNKEEIYNEITEKYYINFYKFDFDRLRQIKGNAKEKGIVLTPKHITDLFCDIAEYYSGEKFTEDTKIIFYFLT